MKLADLLRDVQILGASGPLDVEIAEVRDDSRAVRPGDLFVAVPGLTVDGHDYVGAAERAGAAAILVERDPAAESPAVESTQYPTPTRVRVASTTAALAIVAAHRYGDPARHLRLVAITGTNGKTTTSYLIEAILRAAGRRPGVLGTVNYRVGDRTFPAPFTTPTPLELHRVLAEMRAAGATDVVMETSSHALSLGRLEGVEFRVGAFTNLTQDHLDLHRTMEAYFEAKALLVRRHLRPQDGIGVIFVDDAWGPRMAGAVMGERLLVSLKSGTSADLTLKRAACTLEGISAELASPLGALRVRSRLLGRYNLANIAVAAGVAAALGVPIAAIEAGIERLAGVPGRVERVMRRGAPKEPASPSGPSIATGEGQSLAADPVVLVDYAHTHDALENVIAALRPLTSGRILCVFGCGGDRDRGKRPKMGLVVARDADLAIVTSDNPRTEDPLVIIDGVLDGVRQAGAVMLGAAALASAARGAFVEPDRRLAIFAAIEAAREGDVVLIAGKGHEDYQIIGRTKHPFDDREVAREALAARAAAAAAAITADFVARATAGSLLRGAPDLAFSGVAIDGRAVTRGGLFFAVRGERFDGHDFVAQAVAHGAAGVVVARGRSAALPADLGAAVIEVDDTVRALGELARAHRLRLGGLRVVGVAGSNGKTTTKELIAAILAAHAGDAAVHKTEGNLNNHLGVPLTLLRLGPAHRFAVIEMGMSSLGELAWLAELARPDVGVVVSIGPEHLEHLGTVENVARAEGEIFAALGPAAAAVYPDEEPLIRPFAEASPAARRLLFGEGEGASVRLESASVSASGTAVCLRLPGGETVEARLATVGRHNAMNAACAAACALALDVPAEAIARGLSAARPAKHRSTLLDIASRHVIDDCYNASPPSVLAALDTLFALARDGGARAICVLGDMLELGEDELLLHRTIGARAAALGIDLLVGVGERSRATIEGARAAGMPEARAVHVATTDEAAALAAAAAARPGDVILVKASRGSRLERVLDALPTLFAKTQKGAG